MYKDSEDDHLESILIDGIAAGRSRVDEGEQSEADEVASLVAVPQGVQG